MEKKRWLQIVLALMALLAVGGTMLVNSPRVQERVSVTLATELENQIGTRVSLGGVRWLFPTDIIVDSISIDDQEGEKLLSIPHIAAKIEWKPLLKTWARGENLRISVRNIRIFRPHFNIYRNSSDSTFNYQFLVDAFASKKEQKEPSRLDLRINTLLIRHANVRMSSSQGEEGDSKLSPLNFQLKDLSTHLSLRTLTTDSLSFIVRELNFEENSGLQVDNIRFRFVGNKQGGALAGFNLELPQSSLHLDTLWATWNPLLLKGKLHSSYVTPADLACLLPELKDFKERVYLHADFIGGPSRFNLKEVNVKTEDNAIAIDLGGTASRLTEADAEINLHLNKAMLARQGWKLIEEQYPALFALVPKEVVRIGDVTVKGELKLSQVLSNATLQAYTDAGLLKAKVDVNAQGYYKASVDGLNVNIAKILPTSPLTYTNLKLKAEGNTKSGMFRGTASQTHLLGYEYQKINLEGGYEEELYNATIDVDDPNGRMMLRAQYDDTHLIPKYELEVKVDSLDLHAMKLVDIHEGRSFSTHVTASLKGHDIDQMTGKVIIDYLTKHQEGEDYVMNDIIFNSHYPDSKFLTMGSEFADVTVRGNFAYSTLLSSLQAHLHEYLPSLCTGENHRMGNNLCQASVSIKNTRPLQELLLIPVSIGQQATIKAELYDHNKWASLDIEVPQLNYDGGSITNVDLRLRTISDTAKVYAYGTIHTENGVHIHADLDVKAKADRMTLFTEWYSNPNDGRLAGDFKTSAILSRNDVGALEVAVKSDDSYAVINYEKWALAPFDLNIEPQRITLNNFHFEHDSTQYLNINGAITQAPEDTLSVALNNVDLGYLLSLVKLEGISFGGMISGNINASALQSSLPMVEARINAQDFSFCKGVMGDADINAHWNSDSARLEFIADINETLQDTTRVNGMYSIKDDELMLDIEANNTDISFLNDLTSSFIDNVDGHANGHLLLGGKLNNLDMEGVLLADANLRLVPTNTYYTISDSIRFKPGKIQLQNITLLDRSKNKAILNGVVNHKRISTFDYDIRINADNVMGIDLANETGEESFYTTIYGTGNVHVNGGPGKPLHVEINAETERESVFALNLAGQSETTAESFITFRDRSSKRNTPTSTIRTRRQRNPQEAEGPLQLDIIANITPDAKLKLVMDPATDDHISAKGSGELRIETKDEQLNLFGRYVISHGEYRFNLQDLITRNFTVLEGSYVDFNGDPMGAELDITARYVAPLAKLQDLSPELTGSVQANCLLHIGGRLNAPDLTFNIELPRASEEHKAILRSYTATEEQRNLQFIYLLAMGRFYTQDMAQVDQGARMETFLSSTISGQINNLISNFIDNDNWNFSGNIRTENLMGETTAETWDNMEIEGMLEGRLLNNRLLINGNFGYRNNPIYATNFIGDFDMRYLLTNELSIKGYSKTNDRYFTKTALTTQGLGLLYQRDFNFFWPKNKNEKKETRRSKRKQD